MPVEWIGVNIYCAPPSFKLFQSKDGLRCCIQSILLTTTANAFIHFTLPSQGQPPVTKHYSLYEFHTRDRKGKCAPLCSPCPILAGKVSGKLWALATTMIPCTCLQDELFITNGKATRRKGCAHLKNENNVPLTITSLAMPTERFRVFGANSKNKG